MHIQNMLALGADGVVVGSKVIELIGDESEATLGAFISQLKEAANSCNRIDFTAPSDKKAPNLVVKI